MTDTPAPLSADSLREQLDTWMRATEGVIWDKRAELLVQRIEALIATALQSERQRIADSLPEIPRFEYAGTNGSGGIYKTDRDAVLHGYGQAIEAVRAVLISPTGELGGLETPSEPAEPKDTKSITGASASEEER